MHRGRQLWKNRTRALAYLHLCLRQKTLAEAKVDALHWSPCRQTLSCSSALVEAAAAVEGEGGRPEAQVDEEAAGWEVDVLQVDAGLLVVNDSDGDVELAAR
jgi:hypothetical protein